MSLCFVFSGTSEGREVVERLADSGINCLVFVATEYGNSVMQSHPNVTVNVGRLELEEISNLIKDKNPEYVIDATHPHAKIITDNIIKACESMDALNKYIRVNRNVSDKDTSEECFEDILYNVDSVEAALQLLINDSELINRNILLTTGVKELNYFIKDELKDRIIARIIPSIESLEEAYRCGLNTKSVIAMEGPFSVDMNEALIKQYKAGVLVTKNSGNRGGYREKLLACKKCGIKAIVISNSENNKNGVSVSEAISFVKSNLGIIEKKDISIVGCGVCKKDFLTNAALSAIQKADVIIGAKRMAEFGVTINPSSKVYYEYDSKKVLDIIDTCDDKRIAILYSGDTGLCSGTKGLVSLINDREDVDVKIIPGISSISYFASKIKIQYSDYPFISLHNSKKDFMSILDGEGGFIAICSGVKDVYEVSRELSSSNYNKTIICGYNLASEDEKIFKIKKEEDTYNLSEGLYVIAVIDE